jgi:hypothetical protein
MHIWTTPPFATLSFSARHFLDAEWEWGARAIMWACIFVL